MSEKILLEHTYPNGNRIEVTDKGFILWDKNAMKWVLDASCLKDDDTIRLSKFSLKTASLCPVGHTPMPSLYPAEKKRNTKKKGKK